MKIETLYNQGTANYKEDLLIYKAYHGFPGTAILAAVFDGVSGLYVPSSGPTLFGNLTGGQEVCRIASITISFTFPQERLDSTLRKLNREIANTMLSRGLSMEKSDKIPGAAFVAARITDEAVEIVQGADCFAVWLLKDGTIGTTSNQVFSHEREMRKIISALMEKHSGDRNKLWKELIPILSKLRLQRVNKEGGYALLNGQLEVKKYWQEVNLLRDQIRLLLLFSDGLVPFEETENAQALGEMVVPLYLSGGLRGILRITREIEEKAKATSHIDHAEATAIAIEF